MGDVESTEIFENDVLDLRNITLPSFVNKIQVLGCL